MICSGRSEGCHLHPEHTVAGRFSAEMENEDFIVKVYLLNLYFYNTLSYLMIV